MKENIIGNPLGSFRNKENRAQKLINRYDEVWEKLNGWVIKGHYETKNARLCLGLMLIMETGIRIGNEGSAEGYLCQLRYDKDFGKVIKTYGLTTLERRHFSFENSTALVDFVGKKNVANMLVVKGFVAEGLKKLAQGKDENDRMFGITTYQIWKTVKRYVGWQYSPKDIRLMYANKLFLGEIEKYKEKKFSKKSEVNKEIKEMITNVANKMGHTYSVCRRSYISKSAIEYLKNELYEEGI